MINVSVPKEVLEKIVPEKIAHYKDVQDMVCVILQLVPVPVTRATLEMDAKHLYVNTIAVKMEFVTWRLPFVNVLVVYIQLLDVIKLKQNPLKGHRPLLKQRFVQKCH